MIVLRLSTRRFWNGDNIIGIDVTTIIMICREEVIIAWKCIDNGKNLLLWVEWRINQRFLYCQDKIDTTT
jgi:hypothetical protein